MECLVRQGMDGFRRSVKVETRVRTPLRVRRKALRRARRRSPPHGLQQPGSIETDPGTSIGEAGAEPRGLL